MEYIKVKLNNRVLKVPAEDKERYLTLGYTIYDTDNKLIEKPHTTEVALEDANKKIAELTAEVEASSKALEDANKKIAELEKKSEKAASAPKASTAKTESTDKASK